MLASRLPKLYGANVFSLVHRRNRHADRGTGPPKFLIHGTIHILVPQKFLSKTTISQCGPPT
jgi:hypothetical protein